MTRAENKISYCKYEVEQVINCEFTFTVTGLSNNYHIKLILHNSEFVIQLHYCEELIEKTDINKIVEMIISQAKEKYLQLFYK